MASAKQRLDELEQAANDYFSKERTRLESEFTFLDNISKKRGGNISLQDLNADGASKILVDSINTYLGKIT
jgi:hypothetical protein